MNTKNRLLSFIALIMISILIFTQIFSNVWMILTDQTNYIPKESNIFFFHPTKIDDGSGGYLRYAEDFNQFYYFSELEQNIYYSQSKENKCSNFNKLDISTWCKAMKNYHLQ